MISDSQRGTALITVLFIILLLSGVLATLLFRISIETHIATINIERRKALAATEAAFTWTAYQLKMENYSAISEVNNTPFHFGGFDISLEVQDEADKININNDTETTLTRFFVFTGLRVDESQTLADRIADWRDSDDTKRINGAETRDYILAGRVDGPANREFLSIDELAFVLGMRDELIDCSRNFLTVHSKRSNPDWDRIKLRLYSELELKDISTSMKLEYPNSTITKQHLLKVAPIGGTRRYSIKVTTKPVTGRQYSSIGVLSLDVDKTDYGRWVTRSTPLNHSCEAWSKHLESRFKSY